MSKKRMVAAMMATATMALASYPAFAQPVAQDGDTAAIQQVIQKADHEEEQAIATHDVSSMRDTSTDGYYQHTRQTTQLRLDAGVTSITLNKLECGSISVSGTIANAVDYETWTTVFSDSSTQESRGENDYTLVQRDGKWLIQSDDHPGATRDPLSRDTTSTPTSVPSTSSTATSSSRSSNWSGYASTEGGFTSITDTWTIPEFNPDSGPGMDAPWVGIGGTTTQDLIQAGTSQQSSGTGQSEYEAWLETLPASSESVPLVVRPGDSITVTLTETSPNQWHIALTNNTTGKSYQIDRQYPSSHSSAEWIEEAPTGFAGVLPIDDFGSVNFSGSAAAVDGRQVPLSSTHAQAITLENANGDPLVVVSRIRSDGQSFTAARTDAPDSLPGQHRSEPGSTPLL